MRIERFALVALAAMSATAVLADDPKIEMPDSTGFKFTDVRINDHGPVYDQNKSGTCWAFSGVSALEDEVLRQGGPALDLSEMFIVRQNYIDKAKKYMRLDVLTVLDEYGIVPEEVYSGLNYGEEKHMHYEMADALKGYLDGVMRVGNKRLSEAWLPGFIGILDAYLGKLPETFVYNGKTYTPKEFAKSIGLDARKYKSYTSYTHHPFYTTFPLEIPDNWRWADSYNVTMEDMKQMVDTALDKGYTVAWAADVSEPTFKWKEGYALLPEKKTQADMDGTELARWVKLSDEDRKKSENEVKGPVKERVITQADRQKTFDNRETTDDHGMVIVGYAKDQEGNRYYKVKNSWDTNQIYDGYIYVSEPYFLEKTLAVMINDDAVPQQITKKFTR